MTDQEINMAIAEACGWKYDGMGWWYRDDYATGMCRIAPSYTTDRNAMVAALRTLTPKQQVVFGEYLANEMGYLHDYYEGWNFTADVLFEALTTPLDRIARAFLKTIGKWSGD